MAPRCCRGTNGLAINNEHAPTTGVPKALRNYLRKSFSNVLDFMSAPTPHGNNVNNLKLSCRAVTRTWQLVTSAHYQLLVSTKSVLNAHAA